MTAVLAPLLSPRSVAVVGASPDGPTSHIAANLATLGFAGPLYPVNPRRSQVWDRPAFAAVTDLPGPVDLAVVAVNVNRLREAVDGCVRAGVRSIMIYTAGLAELGEEGRRLQDEVVGMARAAGIAVLGPNCLGFINVVDRTAVAAFPPASLPKDLTLGSVGVVSQSGGLLISTMELGTRLGLGFSQLLSTGNEADVTSLDCLEHLIDDGRTTAIGYVLEGLADGERFLRIARRAADADIPLVVLRLGRSKRGRQAALTHTASIVGSAEEFAAATRSVGAALVRTPAELVDRLTLFSRRRAGRPVEPPRGLAVLTMSGGTRVMVADVAEDHGVELASFSPATQDRLRALLPEFATIDNPLDLTPAGVRDPQVVCQVAEAVAADPGVSAAALVLHLKHSGGSDQQQGLVEAFCAAGAGSAEQFAVISSIPEGISGFWRSTAVRSAVPFLDNLDSLGAFRDWADRERFRACPAGPPTDRLDVPAAPRPETGSTGRTVLTEAEVYPLLELAGVPVAPWRAASSVDEAVVAAAALGYPVVLKAADPRLPHKSDVGGVATGIAGPDELRTAWTRMAADLAVRAPGIDVRDFLVQRMSSRSVEVLVSCRRSAEFGPVLTLGLGGVWTEVLRDVAVRLCPVGVQDVREMVGELRAASVLRGVRGAAPVDLDALAEAVAALSRLALAWSGDIEEIELNPVLAGPDGVEAVDALVVLAPTGPAQAGKE